LYVQFNEGVFLEMVILEFWIAHSINQKFFKSQEKLVLYRGLNLKFIFELEVIDSQGFNQIFPFISVVIEFIIKFPYALSSIF